MTDLTYQGGYDLDQVVVCFAKNEPLTNSDKVFRIEVRRDLFNSHTLQITKGRKGKAKRIVVRGHETELNLVKDLLDLSSRRFQHGYELICAQLTDDLMPQFAEWVGRERNTTDIPDLSLVLYQSLTLLRNRSASAVAFQEFADAFDKTITLLDPQNEVPNSCAIRETVSQLRLPTFDAAEEQNYTDPRRRVVRFLVEHLLPDEPSVCQSIFRALQVPGRFEGNNIVNFEPARRKEQGAHSLRILTLIEQEPRITDLGERLFYAGVKTVCELMRLSEAQLSTEYNASPREILVLRYVLGQHGLHLAADTRAEVKA